jgi:hypothetical protein
MLSLRNRSVRTRSASAHVPNSGLETSMLVNAFKAGDNY